MLLKVRKFRNLAQNVSDPKQPHQNVPGVKTEIFELKQIWHVQNLRYC